MMNKNILNKLKSNSGESIAETLVAVLISALALLMLAGTINTASNLITKSQNTLKDYYQLNSKVEQRLPDNQDSYMVESGDSIYVNFTVPEGEYLTMNDSYKVTLYENTKFSSKPVISYNAVLTSTGS